jgi:hypothetical protein
MKSILEFDIRDLGNSMGGFSHLIRLPGQRTDVMFGKSTYLLALQGLICVVLFKLP